MSCQFFYRLVLILAVSIISPALADPMTLARLGQGYVFSQMHKRKFPLFPDEFLLAQEASVWMKETNALAQRGFWAASVSRREIYQRFVGWVRAVETDAEFKELEAALWRHPRATPLAVALNAGLLGDSNKLGLSTKSLENALRATVYFVSGEQMNGTGVRVGPDLFLTNAHVAIRLGKSGSLQICRDELETGEAPVRADVTDFTVPFIDHFLDIALIKVHTESSVFAGASPVAISTKRLVAGNRILTIGNMRTTKGDFLADANWLNLETLDPQASWHGQVTARSVLRPGASGSPVFVVDSNGELTLVALVCGGGNVTSEFGYFSKSIDVDSVFDPEKYAQRIAGQVSVFTPLSALTERFEISPEAITKGDFHVSPSDIEAGFLQEIVRMLESESRPVRQLAWSLRPRIGDAMAHVTSDSIRFQVISAMLNHPSPDISDQIVVVLSANMDPNWVFQNRTRLAGLLGVDNPTLVSILQATKDHLITEKGSPDELPFSFVTDSVSGKKRLVGNLEAATLRSKRASFLTTLRAQRCATALTYGITEARLRSVKLRSND